MGSGFYMPLDIAKTLMATRYILFARYAIKFALIHLCFRNWKFSHSFLFKLRLAHFHTIEFFFAFSAGGTMQFLPLSDAIVFVL